MTTAAGHAAKSVPNSREQGQQETSEESIGLEVPGTSPWTQILKDVRMLCRMDGQPGNPSCPEVQEGRSAFSTHRSQRTRIYVPQERLRDGIESLADRLIAFASGPIIVRNSGYLCPTTVRLLFTQGGEL